MKKTKKTAPQAKKSNFLRYSLVFFGVLLLVFVLSATFFGLLFLQSAEENLDVRQQASVDDTNPDIISYPSDQSLFKVNEISEITLEIDSKAKNIDEVNWEIQLSSTEGLFDLDELSINEVMASGLKLSEQKWTQNEIDTNSYNESSTINLKFELIDPAIAFNSHDQATTVAKLNFKPQKEGEFNLAISGDDVYSFASSFYSSDNGIDLPQCERWYSEWSKCEDFWQTREQAVYPAKCQWHESEDLEELSRQCEVSDGRGGIMANPNYFYLYTFDKCLNYPNKGEAIYILWNKDEYTDVTWIDVSRDSNFSSFYHKKTTQAYDQNGTMIVNAQDFTGATNDVSGQILSFQPDKTYYFRLYDSEEKQAISSVRFYMGFCSGDQSEFLNCNDRCGEETDNPARACAEGLTCTSGRCRLENNPENELCLDEGQTGIGMANRSCNEYCADSSNCASNFQCYWNHCRLPGNLSDDQCAVASTNTNANTSYSVDYDSRYYTSTGSAKLPSEAYDLTLYACNQGCNTNRDCQANYRCYQGQCRLANNPESASCDMDKVTVDVSLDRSSSDSAGLELVSNQDYQDYWAEQNEKAETPTPSPTLAEKKNFLGQVAGIFSNFGQLFENPNQELLANFNWQWLALAGFLVIAAIVLIIIGLSQKPKDLKQRLDIDQSEIDRFKTEAKKPEPKLEIPDNKPTNL